LTIRNGQCVGFAYIHVIKGLRSGEGERPWRQALTGNKESHPQADASGKSTGNPGAFFSSKMPVAPVFSAQAAINKVA
jgi:hypothetical protein